MTLKLLQDMEVFNVDILFTFLNVYSLDSNNDWHHLQLKFQHFLKPTTLRCEFCESLLKKTSMSRNSFTVIYVAISSVFFWQNILEKRV